MTSRTPWIHSAFFDGVFILAPAFVVSLVVVCAPEFFARGDELPLAWWVVLIVCIDVAHVYSTLFRSYLDPIERRNRGGLLLIVPLGCWLGGIVLYAAGAATFWTVLAYLAVFHFVRQQYGFFMIYARGDPFDGVWAKRLDKAAIYLATIYPLMYWHTHLPREFAWFMPGDFVALKLHGLSAVVGGLYLLVLGAYVLKEARLLWRVGHLNVPKQLLLSGTAFSWYVGIVLYNGDMAFTLTNVVAHGVPYLALVWIVGRKRWRDVAARNEVGIIRRAFTVRALPLLMGLLLMLAYLEEALWDALIWRERGAIFGGWYGVPQIGDSEVLVWLVPLLAVPQATHYILDAFLWRIRQPTDGIDHLLGGREISRGPAVTTAPLSSERA